LANEIDWATVTTESESQSPLEEFTSVTGKLRRIGRFEPELVRRAIATNQPTSIVMNHMDYVDAHCDEQGGLTDRARSFITRVGRDIGQKIDIAGVGPTKLVTLSRAHARIAS